MKKTLTILTIIFGITIFSLIFLRGQVDQICTEKYVLLTIEFNSEEFNLVDKSLETGCFSQVQYKEGDYSFTLKKEQEILFESSFNQYIFLDEPIGEELTGDVLEQDSGIIYLATPNIENSDALEIKNPEGEIIFNTTIYDAGAKICRIK